MYTHAKVVLSIMLTTCLENQLTWALPYQGERKFQQKDTLLWLLSLTSLPKYPRNPDRAEEESAGTPIQAGLYMWSSKAPTSTQKETQRDVQREHSWV